MNYKLNKKRARSSTLILKDFKDFIFKDFAIQYDVVF